MTAALSIVIPCLNEAAGIVRTLELLQPMRARGAEIIVADGGSSDGTATLAASGQQWGRFDVVLDGRHPLLKVIAGMMNLRSRWTGIATGDQGIFMTKELFARVGGFPALPLMEDIALSRQARRAGVPLCLRARIIASARRWERHGVLRTVLLMWRLRLAYFLGADPARLALRYDAARARD